MPRQFYPPTEYQGSDESYNLLPFRFTRLSNQRELLVNEAGEYLTADPGTVRMLARRELTVGSPLYQDLKAKHFVSDSNSSAHLDLLAAKIRTKRAFLAGGTKLHIFVVTLRCDHTCLYCQVSRQTQDKTKFDMSRETAYRSIDLMMSSPSSHLTMEFQGGEALLAFDRVKEMAAYAKVRAIELQKTLDLVITTNLAHLSDEVLAFCKQEGIKISTSLDGPEFLHNANRPRPGNDSHQLATQNIQRCREYLGPENVAALMTTTQLSLQYPEEIINEYVNMDFHTIFLRPISPYGFALRTSQRTGYEMEQFLNFYKKGLERIINLNRSGYELVEVYTAILLKKVLTPHGTGYVDLQSPAGAMFNVAVYNYDGDVYVSDEARMLAEMGDQSLRIGNVHQDTRNSLLGSQRFVEMLDSWCNESLPGCSDCALQTYCGADPIYHLATQGDPVGHRPTSGFCRRNMETIKHLIELLDSGDPHIQTLFWSWALDRSYQQVSEELQ